MEIFKEFMTPFMIAVGTLAIGQYMSIQLKYSATKEEAIGSLKSIIIKIFYWAWIVYLIGILIYKSFSSHTVSFLDVVTVSVITVSIATLLILKILSMILDALRISANAHNRHYELFRQHLIEGHKTEQGSD